MDSYVRDKLTSGLKLLEGKINSAFYDNYGELFPEAKPAEEAVEENIPEVDVEVDAEVDTKAVQEEAQQ